MRANADVMVFEMPRLRASYANRGLLAFNAGDVRLLHWQMREVFADMRDAMIEEAVINHAGCSFRTVAVCAYELALRSGVAQQ